MTLSVITDKWDTWFGGTSLSNPRKKDRSLGNIQHDINTHKSGKNQEIGNSKLKSYNQLIL